MTQRRVAVTGLGAICALGRDMAALWDGICGGVCGIGPITGISTDRLTVRTAAEVRGFDPAAHFEPRRIAALDRGTQLALVAAREAMREIGPLVPERAGSVFAVAGGQETLGDSYRQFYAEDARRLAPLTVPRIMPNAAASHIAMEFGLRGASFAVGSACASAAHAIGLAAMMIRSGELDVVVTGGADASIEAGFMKAWDALRVLSPDVCRPFSRDRAGLVIGEGAGVLVLEEYERARARGAVIYAELAGCGMSADAGDLVAPSEAGAAQAIRGALAGLEARVGYVNAHGTGTRLNDRTEVAALASVFNDDLAGIPVSSSKSQFGHCLNAAAGLESVVTVLALSRGVLPPTVNFRAPDPDCPVDCVANEARDAAIEAALCNSFAFGGLNASLAFKAAR